MVLRQPGRLLQWRPEAFRPRLTAGLALSRKAIQLFRERIKNPPGIQYPLSYHTLSLGWGLSTEVNKYILILCRAKDNAMEMLVVGQFENRSG
jgi:hypothetical protein